MLNSELVDLNRVQQVNLSSTHDTRRKKRVQLKGSKRHAETKEVFQVDAFRKIRSCDGTIWLEHSKGIPVQRGSYTLLNRFLMHWFCRPRGDIKKSGEEIFVNLCKTRDITQLRTTGGCKLEWLLYIWCLVYVAKEQIWKKNQIVQAE